MSKWCAFCQITWPFFKREFVSECATGTGVAGNALCAWLDLCLNELRRAK